MKAFNLGQESSLGVHFSNTTDFLTYFINQISLLGCTGALYGFKKINRYCGYEAFLTPLTIPVLMFYHLEVYADDFMQLSVKNGSLTLP